MAEVVKDFTRAMLQIDKGLGALSAGNSYHRNLGDFDPDNGLNEVGLKLAAIVALQAAGFQVVSEYHVESKEHVSRSRNIDLVCTKEDRIIYLELKNVRLAYLRMASGETFEWGKTDERGTGTLEQSPQEKEGAEKRDERSPREKERDEKRDERSRLEKLSEHLLTLTPSELMGLKVFHGFRGPDCLTEVKSLRDQDMEKLKVVAKNEALKDAVDRGVLYVATIVAVTNSIAYWHIEKPGEAGAFESIESGGKSIKELVACLNEGEGKEEQERAARTLAEMSWDKGVGKSMMHYSNVIVPALVEYRDQDWAVEGLANLIQSVGTVTAIDLMGKCLESAGEGGCNTLLEKVAETTNIVPNLLKGLGGDKLKQQERKGAALALYRLLETVAGRNKARAVKNYLDVLRRCMDRPEELSSALGALEKLTSHLPAVKKVVKHGSILGFLENLRLDDQDEEKRDNIRGNVKRYREQDSQGPAKV